MSLIQPAAVPQFDHDLARPLAAPSKLAQERLQGRQVRRAGSEARCELQQQGSELAGGFQGSEGFEKAARYLFLQRRREDHVAPVGFLGGFAQVLRQRFGLCRMA